jgi:hypothetical protein
MKVSKTGYKKNSKDKNEPALVIPSNKITMKGVEFPVFGIDNTGYSQMMYPGLDYSFPGNYVHELPMAKNGMSAPGPSKVIGGKLEISYDKDRNIYLRSLDGADWTKIEGDRAKEFRTKFAQHLPGYFDPAGSIKQISKKAAKQVGTKQQIVDDKPKYQEAPQEVEPAQEVVETPQSPLQQVAAGVPPMLAKSAAQPSFGNQILSEIGNPEKIRQTKLQSKYQTSPDYHVTPYSSINQANKEYEKTIDYKLRYKNLNQYSTDDIPKIQEKLYNEGYLQKPEQLDVSTFKSKDQVVELQKKLAQFGLMDMLGKGGPNKDGITGTLTKETKDAVKRFNELNKTYKPGELDDMTKQAIKNFKNSTDSKNAMGLPIVNPKELYDPETGEPYTDKTYEAMSVFENSLKSKGYFLGDEGYDMSESAASNPKISFNFKLNPEPTTAFGMCAAYVNGTVCEDDVVGDEARDELGFKGSAWHISENLQNKGGQLVFSGLPDRSAVNLNGKNEITGYLKSQLTSPETTSQLKSIVGDGNLWGKNTKVRPGDVVNIFFEGSGYTEEAYNQTKSLNNKFFTTHVGIVKADDAGNLFVEHNIHGSIEKDNIQDFIDGKVKGNGKNRVSLISGITRPNYVDGVDKDAKIPVTGVSYYQTEDGKFNPRGIFANPGDYLGQTISGENTHKYLTTIEKNKDKLLKDIPISDTEFGKLMRVARVIPTLETYGGQNAEEEKTIVYQIEKGLKDIVSEKSTGFTKLKDASNLGEDLRQNLYQNDDSQLTDPVKAAIPTFYLLSKNYLYLKEVANRNNIDITSDELAKLAGLSYNQSIGKVAGELVDKGSYQNYYDYRVKTASDPGGNFKYRKVMDLYDTQTMKEGGITAPGRFRNPEGNWLNKYAGGGDISIPDLSRPAWLDKYQGGGSKDKNFRRSVDSEYTRGIQKMLNKAYGTGLSVDGVWGPLTEEAYQNHLQIDNLQNQINKLDAKQQAFKNQDASLRKVDTTAKKSSTSVVVPKAENAKKQVESVQREAARVKSKMQETGAKSEAEVYAREKEMAAAQAKLTNQPVLKPAEDKSAGDYLSHAWDIASNPVTAFGYKARGEEIPWGFSQGDRNPLEYATDVINPAFYANAAGRLTDAATTGSTYTKTIPQALGATAGLLMNEEVPEEWNDEAIKTLGIIGDATVVSQGLKAVKEVGTAIRNAKSSNFLNVKQEHTFPGLSNPKVAGNLSLKYNTPLPDHHFKDSGEFLDWYKKTQNNRPFTKKEINFLNKELKERGILEVQRSHPLNPLPNLTRRMLIPEDYNWENVINNAIPNLIKSTKGLDNLYKDYVMGPGRLNAFNQWLGLPTKGTMYRVHPESFQNGKGLLYTTTGNSMKGIFDPELKRLVPKSEFTKPVGKQTFDELDIAIKAANKQPYQKQLEDMGYSDLASFTDETGVTVSRRPNTVLDWDKYTGSAGGASWVRVPIKGGGYEWTMRDTWDIQPFSRMSRMPNFVRDIDVANLIGAKNFDVNWNYRTSPKFNKISNMYYPGKGWTVKKYGGWLDEYQDGSEVKANIPGYNPEVGPTIKNAQLLQELQMQEAVRNSRQLPSGAIQSTLGPIEYAVLPALAAPAIRAAMVPNAPVPDKPKDIPSHLIGHSSPYYGNPKNPTPNKFLYPEQKGWVIGDMKPGRVSKPNPMDYLPRKKKSGGESQGEGYYDYINGYSIFAKGGAKGWLDNYK